MKRKLFLLLCALLTMIGVQNVKAYQTPEANGIYYLYNTGCTSGETGFMSTGNNYGFQVVVDKFGFPLKLISVEDGKYQFQFVHHNGYLSDNGFMYSDGGNTGDDPRARTITVQAQGDGKYKLINTNNNKEIELWYDHNVVGDGTGNRKDYLWQFMSKAERDAIVAGYTTSVKLAAATSMEMPASVDTEEKFDEYLSTNYIGIDQSTKITNGTFDTNHVTTGWETHNNENRTFNLGWGNVDPQTTPEVYEGAGYINHTIISVDKAGLYKVSVNATYRCGDNANNNRIGDLGYDGSVAYLQANNNIAKLGDWYSGKINGNGPGNPSEANSVYFAAGKYLTEVYVYVGDTKTIDISLHSHAFTWRGWLMFNNFKLTYYSDEVSDEDVNALIATIPSHVSDAHESAMATAKTALENNHTIANYNVLAAAIADAQTSANEYAIIDGGFVPTNTTTGWAKSTTNGGLDCNTWSTEGNSDGSGMTTPFIQDHVGSGTPLAGGNAGGKLFYSFTDLNPGETYVVTARIRVFNESATGVTGATYYVGGNSKALNETFSSPCVGDYATKGRFAVLSCAGTVDSNGDLQFGVELDAESPINWISIKDVTISAGTGAVPTAIELSETSKSLTTGSSFVLTSTIAPANADDKTTLWSSSDNTVATVAGGTVVALKAGTATITATAYAGDNVNASCTVTVADAAAPSYYRTSIEDGTDYYIYNAATGLFLGGANSWGTQASGIEHGIPFTATVGDGVYNLDSHTYNSETDHFFNGTYVDGGSTDLYITHLGSGKFSISTGDGSAFVTALAGSTVISNTAANTDSPLAQWYFLSKADRDNMLPASTALNPVDATYYVKQANISRNLSAGAYNVNAWSQYDVGGTQNNSNYVAQVYNKNVDNYQTIENIPNGTYTVSVQAFTSGSNVKFYANNQKVDVQAKPDGVTTCAQASERFAAKSYSNTVSVTVTNRTLKIGFEGDCTGKWLCYDNVEVYMTNYADPTPAEKTALAGAISDAEAKTLGFEDGEYAPYNNVDALTKLAAAKAVDPETASGAAVVAATTALTGATWTANDGSVECVYNGNFAEGQGSPAANIQQYGWTRTNAWGQFKNDGFESSTAYYNQPGSLQYGNAGVYTMPLKAQTIYRLQFKYAKWDGDFAPTVSVLNEESGMAAQTFENASSNYKDGYNSVDMVFVTAAAGNYVLSLSASSNYVITGVSITKAASQTLVFADDAAMPAFAPGTYPSVRVNRTLNAGENVWNSLVLPFDYTNAKWAVRELTSSTEDHLSFSVVEDGVMTAGKPYLVRPNAAVTSIEAENIAVITTPAAEETEKYSFIPVFAPTTITGDGTNYFVATGTNKLYCAKANIATNGYRAYFHYTGTNSGARSVFLNFDEVDPTAINIIEATEAESGALKDGKYLIDGKIVIVKNGVKYGANGQKLN